MDLNSIQQSHEPFSVKLQQNRFLILGAIGVLMIVGVGAAILVTAGGQPAQQPQMAPVLLPEETSAPSKAPYPSNAPDPQQLHTDIVAVVNAVLTATRTGTLQAATRYFMYGIDYWQTPEGVLHALRLDRASFTENGVYDAQVISEKVELAGNAAQVPVMHTILGKQTSSRYDLLLTPAGWRITQIAYGRQPDLLAVEQLQKEHVDSLNQPTYFQTPTTFTLPAGDVIEVEKTLFTSLRTASGAHQDIELAIRSAKRNYALALYDGAYVADSAIILINQPGTYVHSFDIRPLVGLMSGSLLFYPESTTFDRTKPGKPAGVLYEIPIKLDLKQ